MIKISDAAKKQMVHSIEQADMKNIPLRVAIKEQNDGSFHYAMGFDEQRLPGDIFIDLEEIHIVISNQTKDLAEGMTIDYVELEPGELEFIFLNPNDPTFIPPSKN